MYIKRWFLNLLSILLLMLVSSGNVAAQKSITEVILSSEEKAWIADHPMVTATNNMDLAPFDFVRDGQPMGFAIDYLNLIASKVGLKIDYISNHTWQELVEMVKNKQIDILHSALKSESRAQYINFSDSYLKVPIVNFGRVGSPKINSINDLEDKKIGVIKGYFLTEVYKTQHPNFNLVEYTNVADALRALSSSQIDVFTGSLITLNYSIVQNYIPGLEVIGNDYVFADDDMFRHHLGVHKDNPLLMDILRKGMAAITNEEFLEISRKWQTNFIPENLLNLTSDETVWLADHSVIKVSVDPTTAPIEMIDENGEISGIAGDFLKVIEAKLNIKFQWANSGSFIEALEKVRSGEAQMMSAMGFTEQRKEEFILTEKYFTTTYMIFAREGAPIYGNVEGLANQKLVQVKGYTINDWRATNYPNLDVVTAGSINEALKMVSLGQVDAFIGDIMTTSYYISKGGFVNIVVVGETEYAGGVFMGIRKDLPLLASVIQKAMNSISELEKTEISRKWLSLKIENKVNYQLVWKIIIIATIVILIVLIWNSSLRREVERRISVERNLLFSQKRAENAQMVAEISNAAKSKFLANMSHEIRTPLNAIIGFSEAMILGVGGEVFSLKHKEYLYDIKKSGEHLAVVIKDILDLSKIEAGKWHLDETEFSLGNCIKEAIKMLSSQASPKNINIQFEEDDSVKFLGDEHAFKRVIINLLSNSIKFTNDNGTIKCLFDKQGNGDIKIEIIDNGIGIPAERIDHVLNPFEQSQDDHRLDQEGTGLGLSIVKNLIELHNGDFKLTSEVGVGTHAIITLPALRIRS